MNRLSYMNIAKTLSCVAVLAAATTAAFAGPTLTLSQNNYSDGYGGGEFTAAGSGLSTTGYAASTSSAIGAGDFETFCVAYNEEFAPGNQFGYSLGTTTMGDGQNPNVPLSNGVAYLYSLFATGNLTGYDYSTSGGNGTFTSREQAATALQVAIWWALGVDTGSTYSEGAPVPITSGSGQDNYYVNLLLAQTGGQAWAQGAASGSGLDGVSILILTNSNSNNGSTPYSQPQLYYSVPDNGTTIALVGMGLLGLIALSRRGMRKVS